MPKVSVVIPTYNQGKYIPKTIESVLNQTYKDFETIVVIDGSTDDTREQIKKYEPKIKIIEQERSERAVARNTGIKHTCGKYIAFVDSDDIWKSDKLQRQVEVLDTYPEDVLVYSASQRIDSEGNEIKSARRQKQGYSGNVFEKLLLRNFVVSATPMVRREYLEKTSGFETKYVPYEDWELWLRLSTLGNFHFIDSPLAYYRIHPAQSVRLVTAEKIENVTSLVLDDSFRLKEIPQTVRRHSLGLANMRFCYWYLLANQEEKAKEKAKKALELYPKFLIDPRWYGLRLVSEFPWLVGKSIFNLREYH